MRFFNLFAIIVLSSLWSCDKSDIQPDMTRIGYDFFPLQTGVTLIYQVEQKDYKGDEEIEFSTFQLRETIIESFENQSGDSTFIISRFMRVNDTDDWSYKETWSAQRTANQAVVIEGAIPFLKISFPVDQKKIWDGNVLNTMDTDEYQMDSLFFEYVAPDTTYSNTLTIIQSDNQDMILELDRRFEIYALDIGMIYKEEKVLKFCTEADCLGQQVIESGIEYKQRLLSYEKN